MNLNKYYNITSCTGNIEIINDNDSIAGGIQSEDDGINEMTEILKRYFRSIKHEIDILINYFEQFKIIPDDTYTGHQTFRAFVQETKYLYNYIGIKMI